MLRGPECPFWGLSGWRREETCLRRISSILKSNPILPLICFRNAHTAFFLLQAFSPCLLDTNFLSIATEHFVLYTKIFSLWTGRVSCYVQSNINIHQLIKRTNMLKACYKTTVLSRLTDCCTHIIIPMISGPP